MLVKDKTCDACGGPIPADTTLPICPQCLLKVATGDTQDGASKMPTAGSLEAIPLIESLAQRLPQLDFICQLGRGAMGEVFLARQPQLDRLVAVKLLRPAVGGDPTHVSRFQQECRLLAKLNCPGVVAIHEYGELDGQPYFVMEHVDGAPLRELLQRGPLPASLAVPIARQIAAALQCAHKHGIVHRDIKPENVLVAGALIASPRRPDSGAELQHLIKLTDFGISRVRNPGPEHLTGADDVLGTPYYMAPEQLEDPDAVEHRADIYAVGVLLHEMLTGRLPTAQSEPLSQQCGCVAELDRLVQRCLSHDPDGRPATAAELGSLLAEADARQLAADRSPRVRRRMRWLAAGLLALLAVAGAAFSMRTATIGSARLENDALVAVSDEDLTIPLRKLLNNDSLPWWDDYTVEIVTKPRYGDIESTESELLYDPEGRFVGVDRFSYRLVGKSGSSPPASVVLFVSAQQAYQVKSGQPLAVTLPRLHLLPPRTEFLVWPGNDLPPLNPSRPEHQPVGVHPLAQRWRWWGEEQAPPDDWKTLDYDDSGWAEGVGEFGFGMKADDPPANTEVSPAKKTLTTYFRTRFQMDDPALRTPLWGHLLRDDGAAVYLNGIEIQRQNLHLGAGHDSETPRRTDEDDYEESRYFPFSIDSGLLREENVLAVELHQHGRSSKDVGFDFALTTSPLGLLANDYSRSLSAQLVEPPGHGRLTLDADGTFRYQPDPGFTGEDRFQYRIVGPQIRSIPHWVTLHVAGGAPR